MEAAPAISVIEGLGWVLLILTMLLGCYFPSVSESSTSLTDTEYTEQYTDRGVRVLSLDLRSAVYYLWYSGQVTFPIWALLF